MATSSTGSIGSYKGFAWSRSVQRASRSGTMGLVGRPTKTQLVKAIADRIDVPPPPMSTGAKEPKAIFVLAAEHIGLGTSAKASKPELAQAICEAAGVSWSLGDYSRGDTITNSGLAKVLEAVEMLTAT